jgi:hypothetical protein
VRLLGKWGNAYSEGTIDVRLLLKSGEMAIVRECKYEVTGKLGKCL